MLTRKVERQKPTTTGLNFIGGEDDDVIILCALAFVTKQDEFVDGLVCAAAGT